MLDIHCELNLVRFAYSVYICVLIGIIAFVFTFIMKEQPVILTEKSDFYGVKLVQLFPFLNGSQVPMYDVSTVSGLNQLIGFAKFINRDYGEVYYRGVNKVFNTVLPSLMRRRKSGEAKDLTGLVNRLYSIEKFRDTLKIQLPNMVVFH